MNYFSPTSFSDGVFDEICACCGNRPREGVLKYTDSNQEDEKEKKSYLNSFSMWVLIKPLILCQDYTYIRVLFYIIIVGIQGNPTG
jgi:hypothetical protein